MKMIFGISYLDYVGIMGSGAGGGAAAPPDFGGKIFNRVRPLPPDFGGFCSEIFKSIIKFLAERMRID